LVNQFSHLNLGYGENTQKLFCGTEASNHPGNYKVPDETHDIKRLHNDLNHITEYLKSQYPEYWKQFEENTFPITTGNDNRDEAKNPNIINNSVGSDSSP
jgi:hypothetical protein